MNNETPMTQGQIARAQAMIGRIISQQSFEKQEDMDKFLESLLSKPVEELSVPDRNDVERAESLMFTAMDMPEGDDQLKLIDEALKLDPESSYALDYRVGYCETEEEALNLLRRITEIADKTIAPLVQDGDAPPIWQVARFRPLLHGMRQYGLMHYSQGEYQQGVEVLLRVLEYDTDDVMEVKPHIALGMIVEDDADNYYDLEEALLDRESTYSVAMALLARLVFLDEGEETGVEDVINEDSILDLMQQMIGLNPHILELIVRNEELNSDVDISETEPGSMDEAIYVAQFVNALVADMPEVRELFQDVLNAQRRDE